MSKGCRFCEFMGLVEDIFGNDRNLWPIQGAIAIPVQMLESWLLLILDPRQEEDELPFFARQDQTTAKQYYVPHNPPAQLKDLCQTEKQKLSLTDNDDFCFHCADIMDVEQLAQQSRSFALFKNQVEQWKREI